MQYLEDEDWVMVKCRCGQEMYIVQWDIAHKADDMNVYCKECFKNFCRTRKDDEDETED